MVVCLIWPFVLCLSLVVVAVLYLWILADNHKSHVQLGAINFQEINGLRKMKELKIHLQQEKAKQKSNVFISRSDAYSNMVKII